MRLRPVALILLFSFVYPEEGDYRVYQNTGTTEKYVTAVPKKVGVKHENLRTKSLNM